MPSLKVETITPKQAAELLATNTANRNVRKRTVQTYARDMAAGEWRLTGAPIVLNGQRLIDGQHRLLACVAAKVSFETAVLRDADESIHAAIDNGMRRTVADELRWRGEVDVNNLAAVTRILWEHERGGLIDPTVNPSTREIIAFLDDHPGIRKSVTQGVKVKRHIPLPTLAISAVHFLLSEAHGEEIADAFTDKLASGTELVAGDPILALRTYGANVAATRQIRPRREEWLAIVIKVANSWLVGRPIKYLRWRRVGPAAESFPRLIGPDEAA